MKIVHRLALSALLLWALAAPSFTQDPVADGPPYEMDTYYLAFLKRGPAAAGMAEDEQKRIQAAHMAHIHEMAEKGALVGAGPFMDDGELRGIFIFKVASLEEARALTADDPAVQAGRLVMDLHRWMGPKGLGDPYKARMKVDPSGQPRMQTYQFAMLRKGPSWSAEETPEIRELRRRHLGRIVADTKEGVLLAAGPFPDEGDLAGIYIYRLPTADAARARVEQDAMVKTGRFTVEVHPLFMDEGVLPAYDPGR